MDKKDIFVQSFSPVADKDAKILILGTMPGVESLIKNQYYGNNRNHFWKIIYTIFDDTVDVSYAKRKKYILKNHIALWDVLKSCERKGSLDSAIRNEVPNDFNSFFSKYNKIRAVYFNGTEAYNKFKKHVGFKDEVNIKYVRLPSTSPANTKKEDMKFKEWRQIKKEIDR